MRVRASSEAVGPVGRAGPAGTEAVLLVGGRGTRLRPLTVNTPKPMVPAAGVPFLSHQLARLRAAGIEHVVMATSYLAEVFEPYFGDGADFGLRLEYVTEEEPLGTGGAIRNVAGVLAPEPERAVVVLNGDVLSGHDLTTQLADFERPRGGRAVDVSLHLVEVEDARAFGCVPTDASGRVQAFVEKSEDPVSRQVNAGCYVFRRRVVEAIPAGRVVSVERETFPGLVDAGALVVGWVEAAYWRDVGTPPSLVAASRDLVLGHACSPAVPQAPAAAWVDPGARVEGELGDGSTAGAAVTVSGGARVRGSVLMTGAFVGEGAEVVDSVLGPGARVEAGARVRSAAVGDEAVVAAGAVVGPGARVACGTRLA